MVSKQLAQRYWDVATKLNLDVCKRCGILIDNLIEDDVGQPVAAGSLCEQCRSKYGKRRSVWATGQGWKGNRPHIVGRRRA